MRRTDMRRTVVFLLCLLVLAASVGLQGQGARDEQPVSVQVLAERVRSIRELLDERKEQVAIALQSAKEAVQKAEEAQQRVNATQNEFRGSLKDQAGTLATKESVDQAVSRINERLNTLERVAASGVGREGGVSAGQETFRFYLPLIVGALLAALGFYWRRREPKPPHP